MNVGLARISTEEKTKKIKISRLAETGCELFSEENTSGAAKRCPQLEKLFGQLRKNGVVVITKLDRLVRSTAEHLRTTEVFPEKLLIYNHLTNLVQTQRHPLEK